MTGTAAPKRSAAQAAPSRLLSDGRLAQRATGGDRSAFEAIYQRYHQELYRFCLAMVGNPQDAHDTLQNAMVKVLRALPGETREIKLKPWLYRIARNEAIETVRRRRDNAELEPEQASSTVEIAQTAEARERLRGLMNDLEELPERQRGALVMRELAGLGFEQIGNAFQTSAAVARQTVYEARLSLRQMEEGREMTCDAVMRELSDADGRVTRRREIRAHLRSCASCRAFRDSMETRRTDFAAIAPLPVAVSLGLLHGIVTGQASAAVGAGAGATGAGTAAGAGAATGAGAAGSGVAGTVGAGAGKVIATSAIVKSVATVAVVAAVGVTAADRGHLIDVPLLDGSKSAKSASQPATSPQGRAEGPTNRQGLPVGGDRTEAGQGRNGSAGHEARGTARRRGETRHRGSNRIRSQRHQGRAHGRSHASRHGRPVGLPPASHHGQQTAGAHKSPRANPSPSDSPPSKGGGAPPSPEKAPAPSPPPREETVEPAPEATPPPSEPPGQGKGGASSQGAGAEGTPQS